MTRHEKIISSPGTLIVDPTRTKRKMLTGVIFKASFFRADQII